MQEPTVASPIADLPEKISVTTDEPVKKHLKLEYSSQQKQPSDNSVSFFFVRMLKACCSVTMCLEGPLFHYLPCHSFTDG